MKKSLLKLFFYIFLIATIFVDIIWFLNSLSLKGTFLAMALNFTLIVLAVYLFKNRDSNTVLESGGKKTREKVDHDKFAGISAMALSTFFLFYSWSLLIGRELTPAENVRYRFYYDFTIFLVNCCGVYSAALVNLLFAAIFICGGFMLIRKRFK